MTRTHRLFQLMQTLRRLPAPVTAAALVNETGVSLRTIYRDIDALRGLGAVIDGEAGFGYTLIEDAALPPLAFSDDELEALVLGLREVSVIGDPALAEAAQTALSKLKSRLPARQTHRLQHAVLDARRFVRPPEPRIDVKKLRAATWEEVTVSFHYEDAKGALSQRRADPLSIVFMQNAHMLMAWCHLRSDFRAFRLDRMSELEVTGVSFRPKRVPLLRDFMDLMRRQAEERAKDRQTFD
ncbi:helix-turn-helix transcriptional regulator [Sulfitobacter donghicola]|uniref:Transcriptional regulator n=1 Tax=Sulfitobacter donghicola DSW-25 = KCTC 12864 = JCM 14565 TaxID=1300350 RepID=A0A073ILZ2_9RHOB|nr:YafY family protein [Sulfitobacter donghicola]KEJ90575.1 transcriptional regulator [Sulfitobacter donghicola DSW-25 = KCTC 12864 = JCM 14565]KIN67822.1 Helix-turn-helix domain containing protein, type 11 [Sulfitobacter donghicola DSW-25 = KCTC 12864 = JCM 14565]